MGSCMHVAPQSTLVQEAVHMHVRYGTLADFPQENTCSIYLSRELYCSWIVWSWYSHPSFILEAWSFWQLLSISSYMAMPCLVPSISILCYHLHMHPLHRVSVPRLIIIIWGRKRVCCFQTVYENVTFFLPLLYTLLQENLKALAMRHTSKCTWIICTQALQNKQCYSSSHKKWSFHSIPPDVTPFQLTVVSVP